MYLHKLQIIKEITQGCSVHEKKQNENTINWIHSFIYTTESSGESTGTSFDTPWDIHRDRWEGGSTMLRL